MATAKAAAAGVGVWWLRRRMSILIAIVVFQIF
jgi:hypothetical protein